MTIEELELLFHKYGYYSLDKEPYIYSNNNTLGICYSYRDSFYGALTRVYIPSDINDAEEFLRKYTWYNKNRKKYPVDIVLSDYKVMNPTVKYVCQEKELSFDDMKELENTNTLPAKDQMYLEKIKRTAYILVDILHVKIITQQDTYSNLMKLMSQYNESFKELEDELSLFNKNYKKQVVDDIPEIVDKDYSPLINGIKATIDKMNDAKEVEGYISTLLDKLKDTEKNESFIYNKYQLVSVPLKIEEIKQKIEYVKSLINKKKSVFAKKESYEEEFKRIENDSPLKQIVSYESFLNNELSRIDDKYAMIPEIDLRTTADFFIDFDNLNIKVPKMVASKQQMQYEDIMLDLEKNYEVRSREEKNILILYNSLLYKLKYGLSYLEQPSVSMMVNALYSIIKNDNNVLLKIQYLGYLDTYNIDSFVNSLKKSFDSITGVEKDKLLGSIHVFFQGSKDLSNLDYILTSNKVSLAPSQYHGDDDMHYIATLDEGLPLFFVPIELTLDYKLDDTLALFNNKPMIILDTKDFNIKNEKDDIIKVTHYEPTMKQLKEYKIVSELNNNKVEMYQYIRLERK